MALTLGTNCGFVLAAPADIPGELNYNMSNFKKVTKHTSPSTAIRITQIGWYCNNSTEEANFEVGLYAADGAVVPGEAGTLLYVSSTNAKGTTSGWKRVNVNWAISPSTTYWIGVQLDTTVTTTNGHAEITGGQGYDSSTGATSLTNPFGGGAIFDTDGMQALYALVEVTSNGNFFAFM